ncbi:MAG: hypothetical protein H0X25_21530 [Acidobacteriales bacterium]|nr:hypothetical protein [Terriglobales bacterium]
MDMSTTNLFVELLVIGMGSAGWLALLAASALGYNSAFLGNLSSKAAAALPGVIGIYLLGIIVDRIADSVMHSLRSDRKCRKYFTSQEESLKERGFVLTKSRYFAKQFDYNRSRQRICRGWILNALILAVSLNVFLVVHPEVTEHPGRLSVVGTATLLLLALGCWFSWERLADTELKRIRDQAKWLRETGL